MTRPTRRLPLLVAAALLAACGGGGASTAPTAPAATPTASAPPAATATPLTPAPSSAPSAAATPPSQGVGLDVPAVGLSMPLADGWVVLPLDQGAEAILALLPADSQLRAPLEGGLQQLLDAGLAGWAIDGTAAAGELTPNVNLIVREGLDIPAMAEWVGAVSAELAAVPGINAVDAQLVDLESGPAVRATYLALGEGDAAKARGIQYTIPSGRRLLTLSFTVPANDAARLAAVDEMVAGLELEP